jgi:hypothetical protein
MAQDTTYGLTDVEDPHNHVRCRVCRAIAGPDAIAFGPLSCGHYGYICVNCAYNPSCRCKHGSARVRGAYPIVRGDGKSGETLFARVYDSDNDEGDKNENSTKQGTRPKNTKNNKPRINFNVL